LTDLSIQILCGAREMMYSSGGNRGWFSHPLFFVTAV
jgi:hypothetical protein